MSEIIDNSSKRREQLKNIILDLHEGKDPKKLKDDFKNLLETVGASEIGRLEQELINEGLKEEEIKELCDIHASIFEDALIQQPKLQVPSGHPIDTFQKENQAIEKVLDDIRKIFSKIRRGLPEDLVTYLEQWREEHAKLWEIEKHYSRKENILFPYLERNGISGPSKVMWALHDDIRVRLKETTKLLKEEDLSQSKVETFITKVAEPMLAIIEPMIYKEENILFPMCLETLTLNQWVEIYNQSDEIGYCLIEPNKDWKPEGDNNMSEGLVDNPVEGFLKLKSGLLNTKEIGLIFNHLPVDITFVDKDDTVRYFSHGPDRIFERTPAIIGRKVQNCHPPDSVHVVEKIVEDFKAGKKEKEEFWLNYKGMYVYIVYFAVRDEVGNYIGTLEVTQNIKPLQEIKGEKRIL